MSTAAVKKSAHEQAAIAAVKACYEKWKTPRSYIAHLNSAERRGEEAWNAIQKLAEEMGW